MDQVNCTRYAFIVRSLDLVHNVLKKLKFYIDESLKKKHKSTVDSSF